MANEITPNNVYTRTNLSSGAVPAKTEELILTDLTQNSWVMQNATTVDMNDLIKEFNYTTGGPGAYWVSETEKIKTSKPTVVKAELRAHKLAVIVPATQEELNFENPELFDKLAPRISEAFYRKLDEAAILNVDNPFKFSIDASARAAGNVIVDGIDEDSILDLAGLVDDEHETTDFIASRSSLAAIKKASDSKGNKIYDRADGTIDSVKTTTLKLQGFNRGTVYAADKKHTFVGIPKGFEYKILDQGTISSLQNTDGSAVNLGEQDMQALRVTFYVAFMVGSDSAFAVLESETAEPEVGE